MESSAIDSLAVVRAVAGDRDALASVLAALERPLCRYITRLIAKPDVAEDVLQEVLFRVCRKIRWLRDPELILPWAFRIASRQCFRQLRSERQRKEEALDLDTLGAATKDTTLKWEPRLADWISALPPASRSVIALHYLEDMSIDEVATVLEISPGTVKSRLAYGLVSLRKQVAGLKNSA